MNELKLCEGIKGQKEESVISSTAEKFGSKFYSKECQICVNGTSICKLCFKFMNRIRVRQSRTARTSTPNRATTSNRLRKSLHNKSAQLAKNQRIRAKAEVRIIYLHKKFQYVSEMKLESAIRTSELPENMKLPMIEAAKLAKMKSKNGIRYGT